MIFGPKKKFFIPFNSYTKLGGPHTFMRNLKDYLDSQNFEYVTKRDKNAKGIFFPISYPMDFLTDFKGSIIQRLDGVHHESKSDIDALKRNEVIKKIYLEMADFIIFQSDYSKKQCFEVFGEIPEDKFQIIINGVNKSVFYPADKSENTKKIKFITTGNFRNIDMLEPVILALDSLTEKFQFQLSIVGPIANPDLEKYLNRDYINLLGDKSTPEVAELLRDHDIFIYSHLNPPCPNSVVEAVATGLPVVGFDSGAMSELLPFSTKLLASVTDEVFQQYKDFDYTKLAKKLELCITEFSSYKKVAMENAHLYNFEDCGKAYLDIFKRFI